MNKIFKLFNISFINGDYNDAFSRLNQGPGLSAINEEIKNIEK